MGKLWNALKRLANVMFGWMFQGVEHLESSNPEAMLALERQKFQEAKAKYNQGRATTRSYEVRIERQIEADSINESKLAASVKGLLMKMQSLAPGSEEYNRFKAAAAAKSGELKRLRASLEQSKEQLATVRAQAEEQTRQYRMQTQAYDRTLQQAAQLISDTKMKEAMAEFHQATSDLSFEAGTGVSHLMESLKERNAKAEGKIRVAQDNVRDNMDWEIEQASLEAQDDDALSEMMGEFGMAEPAKSVKAIKPAALPPARASEEVVEMDAVEAEFDPL